MSRKSLVLLLAAPLAVVAAATAPAKPVAHTARSCGVGSGQGYGYTYLTSLTVKNTSCANGKHLVHHHGNISGWHCSRKILDHAPGIYDARKTCTSGNRRVIWTFQQNT
jgi:hypothetical protein